jgi:hypothetical protein
MANKSSSNEDGFVAVVLVVVVVVALAWWGIASLTGKDSEADTKASTTSLETVAAKIEADKNVDICTYTDNRESGAIKLLLGKATTNFVNLAKTIDTNVCKSFQYGLFLKTTDGSGEESNTSVLTLRLDDSNRDAFNSYDRSNLEDQSIGEKLKADNILTKINLNVDGASLDKVTYKGSKTELQ